MRVLQAQSLTRLAHDANGVCRKFANRSAWVMSHSGNALGLLATHSRRNGQTKAVETEQIGHAFTFGHPNGDGMGSAWITLGLVAVDADRAAIRA